MNNSCKVLFKNGYIPYLVSSKLINGKKVISQLTVSEQEPLRNNPTEADIENVIKISEYRGYKTPSIYITGNDVCVLDIDIKKYCKLNNKTEFDSDDRLLLKKHLRDRFGIELDANFHEWSSSGGLHVFFSSDITARSLKFYEWNNIEFDLLGSGFVISSVTSPDFKIVHHSMLNKLPDSIKNSLNKSSNHDSDYENIYQKFLKLKSYPAFTNEEWLRLGSALKNCFSYDLGLELFKLASCNTDYPDGDSSCEKTFLSLREENVVRYNMGNILNLYHSKVGDMINLRSGKYVPKLRKFDFKELSEAITGLKIYKTYVYGGRYIFYREVGENVSVFPNYRECSDAIIRELDIVDISAKDLISKCIVTKHISSSASDINREHELFGSILFSTDIRTSSNELAKSIAETGITVINITYSCEIEKYTKSLISNRYLLIYAANRETDEEAFILRFKKMTCHLSDEAKPIVLIVRNYHKNDAQDIIYVSSETDFVKKSREYKRRLFNISSFQLSQYEYLSFDAVLYRAKSPKNLDKFLCSYNATPKDDKCVLIVLKLY